LQHLGAHTGAQQEGLQHLGAQHLGAQTGAQQDGLQHLGAHTGAQHLGGQQTGAGAQQQLFFFLNRPRILPNHPLRQDFFLQHGLQQGSGQHTGAGAQHLGGQQTGAQHLGLQQGFGQQTGAQQVGLQQTGAGAQHLGAQQLGLECPKSPASAWLATAQTTRAAIKDIHFISFLLDSLSCFRDECEELQGVDQGDVPSLSCRSLRLTLIIWVTLPFVSSCDLLAI